MHVCSAELNIYNLLYTVFLKMGDERSSFNTELASISLDDEVCQQLDLLERLDSEDISTLRQFFFTDDPKQRMISNKKQTKQSKKGRIKQERGQNYGGIPLTKKQFIKAVEKVVGNNLYSESAGTWFDALDATKMGLVWWEEVLDGIIEKIGIRCAGGVSLPVDSHVEIMSLPHCKRESIVKMVPIETPSTFCYAIITKFGRVGVYDGRLQLLDSYVIGLSEGNVRERIGDSQSDGGERRRRITSVWLTDAVHIPDANALLLVCSDRSLHLYDCSSLIHAPLCHVKGMKNVPQCLAYCVAQGNNPSLLFIGDSAGNITRMSFFQPRASLFRKKHPDKLDTYYWVEVERQSDYVEISVDVGVHGDSVRQVAFFPDNETVVSCSQDPSATLVIRHMAARKTPYIFKLARGVRCFHLDRSIRLLVTGSNDYVVRLWNPVVTKQPIVSLFGHKSAVIDVIIMRHLNAVFSCSRDGVLKVWDIDDQCCIQTTSLNFPSFSVLGKLIEFGTRSMYPGPSSGAGAPDATSTKSESLPQPHQSDESHQWHRGQLLVCCCDHVALLRVKRDKVCVTPPPLPPPSREHHAAVPSPWTAADARGVVTPDISSSQDQPASRVSSRSSYSSDATGARMTSLQGLNVLRAKHERQQAEVRPLVEQCAPHLALRLWDIQDIHFSSNLPLTRRMRDRRIDLSDPEKLMRARLPSSSSYSLPSSTTSSLITPRPGRKT